MKRREPPAEPERELTDIGRMAIAMRRRAILDTANSEVAREAAAELQALADAPAPDVEKARAIYHRLPWRTA